MGIIANSAIVFALLYFLISLFRNKELHSNGESMADGAVTLSGFVLTSLGTVGLYIQQGFSQRDFTIVDTLFPYVMVLGYYVAVVAFLGVILIENQISYGRRILIKALTILVFAAALPGIASFICYWNDGAILLTIPDQFSDMLSTYPPLLIGLLGFVISISKRLDYLECNDFVKESLEDKSSRNFIFASFAFLAQFLVPRATSESITNPFTIKIVGVIILLGFGYYLANYLRLRTEVSQRNKTNEQYELEVDNFDMGVIMASTLLVALYIFLMNLRLPVLTVSEKLDAGYPLFYIGHWYGYDVFLDAFGCVIPLILEIAVLFIILIKRHSWAVPNRGLSLVLVVGGMISFSISATDALFFRSVTIDYAPRFSVLPFVFAPLLSWILIRYWKRSHEAPDSNDIESRLEDNRRQLILTVLLVYSTTGIAAVLFDILTAYSPYGILQFGGASLIDGLLWAPILTAAVFAVFLAIRKIVDIDI
jgi:hypothetical protein